MISNAGPRRTSEQDCSKKEKRKTPRVQQSVTKDLRGKINKTPTGAFKMCAGSFWSTMLQVSTQRRGHVVYRVESSVLITLLEILYSCINLKMHTINFSSIFSPSAKLLHSCSLKTGTTGRSGIQIFSASALS